MDEQYQRQIAVISDVHGNRWALNAVMEDIRRRWLSNIVNLGDCLFGPLDPAGTADLLMSLDIPTVSGNQDREIIDRSIPDEQSHTLKSVRGVLSSKQIVWLESHPPILDINNGLTLFHGTPEDDVEYLIRCVSNSGLEDRPVGEIEERVAGLTSEVILCGHDHLPGEVRLSDGRLVVNPGSVGLQAYTDDDPHDHVVQTGSPHARYAILSDGEDGWQVEFVAVEYDWSVAAETADQNGRPDWAEWLRTGRSG